MGELVNFSGSVPQQFSSGGGGGMETMDETKKDKYIDQRFKNIDEKIDHKMEVVSLKIDALTDSVNTNTEWMKMLIEKTSGEVGAIKGEVDAIRNDGKTTRKTVVNTGISVVVALFLGLSGILYMINQMQNSWLQEYLRLVTEAFLK